MPEWRDAVGAGHLRRLPLPDRHNSRIALTDLLDVPSEDQLELTHALRHRGAFLASGTLLGHSAAQSRASN
jgi:hypothetical protein